MIRRTEDKTPKVHSKFVQASIFCRANVKLQLPFMSRIICHLIEITEMIYANQGFFTSTMTKFCLKFISRILMASTCDSEEKYPLIQSNTDKESKQAYSSIEAGCHSALEKPRELTRYLAVLCILVIELCERLTYFAITVNMVFYCQNVLKLASPLPSTINLIFQGKFSPAMFDCRSFLSYQLHLLCKQKHFFLKFRSVLLHSYRRRIRC